MFIRALVCCTISLACSSSLAQVIEVEQIEKGWLIQSAPTLTALREASDARAVILSIPGGEGRINLRKGMETGGPPRTAISRALVSAAESVGAHVVAFDSPYVLPATAVLSSRETRDHLVRLESVVQYYHDRYKLPVWIFGHSNGGYSAAELLKHLGEKKKLHMIGGLIFSAGRDISRLPSEANLPALFMIAERDGCHSTTVSGNSTLFEKFKAGNKAATEFVLIQGGEAVNNDPCFSGIHMYSGADEEVGKAIAGFMSRHVPAR